MKLVKVIWFSVCAYFCCTSSSSVELSTESHLSFRDRLLIRSSCGDEGSSYDVIGMFSM